MLTQRLIAILALALTVSASPLATRKTCDPPAIGGDGEGNQRIGNEGQNSGNSVENSGNVGGDVTIEQSMRTCGNAQLNCCNKISKKGDSANSGVSHLFKRGDLGIECSPVNAGIGILGFVNDACKQTAVCCQGDTIQNGLINIGCLGLGSLL